MDGIYLRAKIGCAKFHLQAIMSQHQDLRSRLQCLEAQIWAFSDANPCLIKTLSNKHNDSLVSFIARRASNLAQKCFALAMLDWLSGKRMRFCWLGRKLMLIFFHAGEFSCRQFCLGSEFQSSDCFQHTAIMLKYESDLYSAPGSTLWGSVQLLCKNDPSSHGAVK